MADDDQRRLRGPTRTSPLTGLARGHGCHAIRGGAGEPPAQLKVERSKREEQGDYSTNAAMLLAPVLSAPPREIAERIGGRARVGAGRLTRPLGGCGAGVPEPVHVRRLAAAGAARRSWPPASGSARAARDPAERILVEFVSANPTGPLVAASGRHAAYGDALARILEHHGHEVSREYYFNDAGGQIRLLGESVQARARGEEVPEGGYQGDYVADLAAEIPGAADGDRGGRRPRGPWSCCSPRSRRRSIRYGVQFDRFFSERTLHEGSPSELERALEMLDEAGHTYRSRGRQVAAHDDVRRRQGPRRGAVQRRADVPGGRHRLPAEQARARVSSAS